MQVFFQELHGSFYKSLTLHQFQCLITIGGYSKWELERVGQNIAFHLQKGNKPTFHFAQNTLNSSNTAFTSHANSENNGLHCIFCFEI
jgi:hypothetical protein